MRIIFNKYPQIIAGISERKDSSMVWWNRLPLDKVILKNRNQYFKRLGINPKRVVAGGIAHGVNVAVVGKKEAGKYLLNTDALITNVPNLFLTITTADCMPVFCYDSVTESFGIIHAGWRGLIGGILENTIKEFHKSYGADAENLLIKIGPHIKSCHYEVGKEVASKFAKQNIKRQNNRLFAKLTDEAEMRLHKLGIKNIFVNSECTYCDAKRFYSARYDKTEPLQGMLAYIGKKL